MKLSKLLPALLLLSLAGCDYIPRTVYEIETVDGQTIRLACPAVPEGRSTYTYLIEGQCVVYADE